MVPVTDRRVASIVTSIVVVPLDDRPICGQLAVLVGRAAGADVVLPPSDSLGSYRTPGDHHRLESWLLSQPNDADVVVSLDQVAHGGLVPSRITTTGIDHTVARLSTIAKLRANGHRRIVGFTCLTRAPAAADATEEPAYWTDHGPSLHHLGALEHTVDTNDAGREQLRQLRATIPDAVLTDHVRRRLRNHIVNLAALDLVATGALDYLVVAVDDSATHSSSRTERTWLQRWVRRLGIEDRVVDYDGTDEVAAVLVGRVLSTATVDTDVELSIAMSDPTGLEAIPPYADEPLRATLVGQLGAARARVIPCGDADRVLVVHAPDPERGDWALGPTPMSNDATRRRAESTVDLTVRHLSEGRAVAVADVAYANGADRDLIDVLTRAVDLSDLAGYAGWNTAGNSLGTAIAQLCAHRGGADHGARSRMLATRIVDDWSYQTRVRDQLRAWLVERGLHPSVVPPQLDEAARRLVADGLQRDLADIPGLDERWRVDAGSVHLPWGLTFHVGFELERRP